MPLSAGFRVSRGGFGFSVLPLAASGGGRVSGLEQLKSHARSVATFALPSVSID